MRKCYVLRKDTFENKYELDYIEPHEALYAAITRDYPEKIYFSDYLRIKRIDDFVLEVLEPLEIKVILYRFGFTGEWYSLKQIGDMLNFSSSYIGQVEYRALRKMRRRFFNSCAYPIYMEKLENETAFNSTIEDVVISGLKNYVFKEKRDKIIESILIRNEIVICEGCEDNYFPHYVNEIAMTCSMHRLLTSSGIRTLEDVISKSYEEISLIMQPIKFGMEEIIKILETNNIPFYRDWCEYISMSEKLKCSELERYLSVDIEVKKQKNYYKLEYADKENIAKCIYDKIVNEYGKNHLIYNYKISTGLIYLLLIKGYLFVEKIVEDKDSIEKDLILGGYGDYIEEFKIFVEDMQEMLFNEENPSVSICVLNNKIANSMIRKEDIFYNDLMESSGIFEGGKFEDIKNVLKRIFSSNEVIINPKERGKNDIYTQYL